MKSKSYQILIGLSCCFSQKILARSIFLNGVDISSAKTQQLKKVDVKIDEKGDIHIMAPHYQVHEENTFVPLSAGRVRLPVHIDEPLHFQKEGDMPGVPEQIMHGADKSVKKISDAQAVKPAQEAKPVEKASDAKPIEKPELKTLPQPETKPQK